MGGATFIMFLGVMFGSLASGFLVDKLQDRGMPRVVVINLAAQSYREGRTLYWDAQIWKATDKAVKA